MPKRRQSSSEGLPVPRTVDPVVVVAMSALPRLGASSPLALVSRDVGLFRAIVELCVFPRRPVVTWVSRPFYRVMTEPLCALGDDATSDVRFGRPRLESCCTKEVYEVLPGWTNKQWVTGLLGYRGLSFWGVVASHYRRHVPGHRNFDGVPESALLGVVSWNPHSGDVVGKTLVMSGQEAYDCFGFVSRSATWSWPLVAFASCHDKVCVASAETGAIIARIDMPQHVLREYYYGMMAMFLVDCVPMKSSNSLSTIPAASRKRLCTVTSTRLECMSVDDPTQVWHRTDFEHLIFAHPDAIVVRHRGERGSCAMALDPARGRQLASCSKPDIAALYQFGTHGSYLWTLEDVLQLVAGSDFRSVQFQAGGYWRTSPDGLCFVPNGAESSDDWLALHQVRHKRYYHTLIF